MRKIDYIEEFEHLYFCPDEEVMVGDISRMNFIVVDSKSGHGTVRK